MGEPARKLDEDDKPDLQVIEGGGNTTPERGNLSAVPKNNRHSLHLVNGGRQQNRTPFTPIKRQEDNPTPLNRNQSIQDQEKIGSGGWKNSVNGIPVIKSKKDIIKLLKGKGAVFGILLVLIVFGGIITIITSSSLLLVNFKEVLTEKFNYQLASMDLRTNKILKSKITGTTKGVCGTVISIKCKYSTMTDKQIEKFKKAGIEIETGDTTVTGRKKVTSIKYGDESISADEFMSRYLKDPNFRSTVKKAYNPKYVGFSDSILSKIKSKFKISKSAADLKGDTDEDKLKSVQKDTQNGSADEDSAKKAASEIAEDENSSATQDEIDNSKDGATNATDELFKGADEVKSSGEKATTELLGVEKGTLSKASSAIGIASFFDNGCTVYNTIQGVAYAAKAVRAIQLARYAMIFLNVADQIKAGQAVDTDTSYLGKVLTTIDSDGKSATDSEGYKYAAYGDSPTLSSSASQYLAGGGLTGKLSGITDWVNEKTGGNARSACKITTTKTYQAISLGIGIVAIGLSGGLMAGADIAKAAVQTGLQLAAAQLPTLLKDIVAGVVVDSSTVGGQAGNAVVSGVGQLLGGFAQYGGNAPLTPTQAVAYNNLSQEVAQNYADEDRATLSPFDTTNQNTFLGKITYQIVPYLSKFSSLSGVFSSLSSLITTTFASILSSNTKAVSASDYETCKDFDYRALNLATDPFCNIVYGIPTEDLGIDPDDVVDYLTKNNDIDESGKVISGSEYEKFQKSCINRTDPLGYNGQDDDDGSECLYSAKPENKYYYLYYVDQRVLSGMEDSTTNSNSSSSTSADSAQPDNTTSLDKGWTLEDNVDYSGVQCPSGTTDNGTYTHPTHGYTIRLCGISGFGGQGVASIIAQRVVDLVSAAAAAGFTVTATDTFRSYEAQEAAHEEKPNITSPPGSSQHERGLAIDFNNDGSDWDGLKAWLDENAKNYSLINLDSEAWHWSTSGD